MKEISQFMFFNQMAGPLFREMAEDLAEHYKEQSVLKTGHPDTLKIGSQTNKLKIDAYPSYNRKSYLTRIISWIKYTIKASFAMLKSDKQTAILIVSNPPLLGPAAWLTHKIKKTPYIVFVYDMHPDSMVSFGVLTEHSLITKIWRAINRAVWNTAEAVYTLGPVMAATLSKQFNVAQTRLGHVGIIPPWADTDKIKPIDKTDNPLAKELNQVGKITVLYSGNMGISHDIDSILQAILLLKDDKTIAFLMIGEGEKWQDAVDFQKKHQLTTLQVLPFQPEEKLPYTMPLADIALVALDEGAEGLMIPSKMFYYMAAGAAVIGICRGRNDIAEILIPNHCGIIVEPNKPEILANKIQKLANNPAQLNKLKCNARHAALENYSRKACMQKMNASLSTMWEQTVN